jgi:hypothetical protein
MNDIAAVAMRATDAVHAALPKLSNNIASKLVQRLRTGNAVKVSG